jgi:hypothetical protein
MLSCNAQIPSGGVSHRRMEYQRTTHGVFNLNLYLEKLKITDGVHKKLPTPRMSILLGTSMSLIWVRMIVSKIHHHQRSPRLYTSLLTIETWEPELCQQKAWYLHQQLIDCTVIKGNSIFQKWWSNTNICEVSGLCEFRRIHEWLIMNYTKFYRIVINNNKIYLMLYPYHDSSNQTW